MARSSKSASHPFTIYQDSGIPTPDSAYEPSFDDAIKQTRELALEDDEESIQEDGEKIGAEERMSERKGLCDTNTDTGFVPHDYDYADDERRVSAVTQRTSVSSLPEWTDNTDVETKPYTPPLIRPSFMRPESVRRMQMRSPPPFSSRNSRQSVLRHSRSRTGTPQSVRSSTNAHGSPRSQRHISEETTAAERAENAKLYPLVLLHVTLLPMRLPWSLEAMQELLPESTLDQLQVLKGKVSDTILQRGILIPHPKEEYEMLEERLLEALELEEERVTKCGHFRGHARESTSSISTVGDSSDSGIGSSVEGLDSEVCDVCHHGVRSAKSAGRKKRWAVKIYAANGLMRTSAWAAAWSEMERVDVEILPFIGEGLRKQLDARQEADEVEERARLEVEDERARALFDEHLRSEDERRRQDVTAKERMEDRVAGAPDGRATHSSPGSEQQRSNDPAGMDLPRIYRPSEIPLSILVKNYIFLLAQDRRNVVICFLVLLVLLFGMRCATVRSSVGSIDPMVSPGSNYSSHQYQTGLLWSDNNTTSIEAQANATDAEPGHVSVQLGQVDVSLEDVKDDQPDHGGEEHALSGELAFDMQDEVEMSVPELI